MAKKSKPKSDKKPVETPTEPVEALSDDSDGKSGKAGGPIHRVGIGVNVAVQILLVVALFIIVNYLSFRHYQRWDMTDDQVHSLSESTRKVLKSLREDVEITVAFVGGSEYSQKVDVLVEEYDRSREKRVNVQRVDPIRNPSDAEDLKNRLGVELDSNMVIITSGKNTRVVREDEMLVRAKDEHGNIKVIGFRGEDALTSAILSVTEREQKKVYFLRGKGKEKQSKYGSIFGVFQDIGYKQNLDVQPLDLPSVSEFPEDTDAVILPGMIYDLSERELGALKDFWENRKGSLLIMVNPRSETPRLNGFLKELGVERQFDRVMWSKTSSVGVEKHFDVNSYFLPGSPITLPMIGTTAAFGGQTCSLQFPMKDDELLARGLQVTPLLRAADDYWGETHYLEETPIPDDDDNRQPLFVAASVELGGVDDPALKVKSARMVVVGNDMVVDPNTFVGANYDFATASLNWMLDREQLIGVTPKIVEQYRPNITPQQETRLFLISCILLPGAMLALGLFVWSVRRS